MRSPTPDPPLDESEQVEFTNMTFRALTNVLKAWIYFSVNFHILKFFIRIVQIQDHCVINGIGEKILNGDDEPPLKRPAVYKLPSCVPLSLDENGVEIRIRIPKPLDIKVSSNLDLSNVSILYYCKS